MLLFMEGRLNIKISLTCILYIDLEKAPEVVPYSPALQCFNKNSSQNYPPFFNYNVTYWK